jgi:hypothetical protein
VDFLKGSIGSSIQIGDTSNLKDRASLWTVYPNGQLTGKLGEQQLVVLTVKQGEINVTVRISSSVHFGDWTDRPSLFGERGNNTTSDLPLYIETIRDVRLWIWIVLFGVVAFVIAFTAFILFFRPLRKLGWATIVSTGFPKTKTD